MEIIKVENLKYWYPDSDEPAIRDISLTVNEGEFILIAGPSGCGKSTLLRVFNRTVPDFYGGKIQGSVFLNNKSIRQYDRRDISKSAGMVYQHPEKQTVMEDVEREIAFGLENLNFEMNKMKRNVAEVISFLNLGSIRENTTSRISGGELQKTAIASVIAMDPDILLFDEPISQLDPIASEEVLNFIKRLNRDMGKTIILVEQRLDRCFELADRILFMEEGRIISEGKPHDLPREINKKYFLPAITHIFRQAGFENPPITVKDAKKNISHMDIHEPEYKAQAPSADILQVRALSFQYERGRNVLRNVNLSLKRGKITAVMGENGAGKSTLFKIIAGLLQGYSGQVLLDGREVSQFDSTGLIRRIGYLSQNPNDYLGRPTVFEEVAYTLKNIGEFNGERVEAILKKLGIYKLRDKNPRDLSGGEKQRVAIACTIVTNPDILILDEPTRGLDAENKGILGELLRGLADEGKSIVLITHDSDFAGDFTDDVILMFSGEIVAGGNTREILHDSIYYSPQVARAFKNKCKIVSSEDALRVLRCSK